MTQETNLLEKLTALCKRRGFIYPSSEIYGGLANAYDYGPYGTELLRNIKNIWWKTFIHDRQDMLGIDSQIIVHPQTWVASGHVSSFADPLVEDKVNHLRFRADHLIEKWLEKQISSGKKEFKNLTVENMSMEEMGEFIKTHKIKSPEGNELTEPKKFNLLFETYLGIISGNKAKVYLRGETAQGIFLNFKNIINSQRVKLPFGIGQIGKSFRNEVTTGQFVFRTFEFEQAEIEYFFNPNENDWQELMKEWKELMWNFITKTLGITENNLRWRRHTDKERSHYSKDTYDLDYHFPFGWKELWGIAYRTDYDLKQHSAFSGQSLEYKDSQTGKSFIPHVIEPALGINRVLLMLLADSYREETVKDKQRMVLSLPPVLSPVKIAVFPLQKDEELQKLSTELYQELKKNWRVEFDDSGNIGKMYRRQDEIGTPFCVTVDFDSLTDKSVTVRERDTMKQERVKILKLKEYFLGKFALS